MADSSNEGVLGLGGWVDLPGDVGYVQSTENSNEGFISRCDGKGSNDGDSEGINKIIWTRFLYDLANAYSEPGMTEGQLRYFRYLFDLSSVEICGTVCFVRECSNNYLHKFRQSIGCQDKYYCPSCRRKYYDRLRSETYDLFDVLSQLSDRVEFGKWVFTVPSWASENINRSRELKGKLIQTAQRTVRRFWEDKLAVEYVDKRDKTRMKRVYQAGGLSYLHDWSTEMPWVDHAHVEVIFPNIFLKKNGEELGDEEIIYKHLWLEDDDLSELAGLWKDELNKMFGWGLEKVNRPNVRFTKSPGKLRHWINYALRNALEDVEGGFQGVEGDMVHWISGKSKKEYRVELDEFSHILSYKWKGFRVLRWFGWLGGSVKKKNLLRVGIGVEENGKPELCCPKCDAPLLRLDEFAERFDLDDPFLKEYPVLEVKSSPRFAYKMV